MDLFKKIFLVLLYLTIELTTKVNCIQRCTTTKFSILQNDIDQFRLKNLKISDQPFYYFEKKIFQVAISNIEFEYELKRNEKHERPIKKDPNKLPKYFILLLEEKNGNYTQLKEFSFGDNKIVGLTTIQSKLIAVSSSGLIRIINLSTNELEEQYKELKVKDVQGIYKYNRDHFVVYGRTISINQFVQEKLVNIFNEIDVVRDHLIKNVAYLNERIYFFTSKELFAYNINNKIVERKATIQDYKQAYLFQLFQNVLLILPQQEGNQTQTYMLYDINMPSKQPSSLTLGEQYESIKSAVSYYRGQVLVKNEQNEVRSIEFDEDNIQIRNQTQEKLKIGIDSMFSSTKQILLLSFDNNTYIQNQCFHCEENQFLVIDDNSPSYCKSNNSLNYFFQRYINKHECGYKCQSCNSDKSCIFCYQSYSLKSGICSCANRYAENLEKGICEKQEEQDPIFYIIIASIIFVIVSLICIVKYLQIQKRERIEIKKKIFNNSFKDEDEDHIQNDEDENKDDDEDQDQENFQYSNVATSHNQINGNKSFHQTKNEEQMTKNGQIVSKNISFEQQNQKGQQIQIEYLENKIINKTKVSDEEEDGYFTNSDKEMEEYEDD